MSQTGKIGRSATIAGAAMLPVTGEKVFSFLPIVGSVLVVLVVGFSVVNWLLRKRYHVQ
jgi:uncharacterized surface anchored protein